MNKEKRLFWSIGILQGSVGVGAVLAGIGFIMEPDGSNLLMTTDILEDSPFESFLIPGIVLLAVNGLGSLAGAVLSFIQSKAAGEAAIILGTLLMGWIAAQIFWIGYVSFLQPVFFGVGAVEAAVGYFMMRMVRKGSAHASFTHSA
ncbi:hypothetical protein [Bacillus marinisedimentorum]|uniref:hypothetical protein n=1 Tax=Bacillus marinisedimentorum TaxID=1821260 RepID=UPI0008726397|nr:hypothetical protein [Bacillus marinisedimentorum]